MTSRLDHTVRLNRPADFIAIVPYMLGFHPERSIVAMAFEPAADPDSTGRGLRFSVRVDLPDDSEDTPDLARRFAELLTRNGTERAMLIGYGPGWHVTPVIDAVRGALSDAGIDTIDALRVEDGRYWSYTCPDPDCCSPNGVPYDAGSNLAAAAAVFAGYVARPDRAALEAMLAPDGGQDREQVQAATRDACAQAHSLLTDEEDRDWYHEGLTQVAVALDRTQAGQDLSADEVAWLGVRLSAIFVRDAAMTLIGRYDDDTHIRLWTQLTRRVEPDFAAPPAALLAFLALRTGDGPLARVAVERALSVDPRYSLAGLIRTALDCGLPPEAAAGMDCAGMADEIADKAAQCPDLARPVLPVGW
ncbi:DUF4192 domain-containing protein [Microbispora sp. ATCC PTA-5024]|uniref:DUF4192 domain-containing protein n=1 Tax=Microbispora sp. ATCC PTA-5024 TaxID=316330 RepID=UPI0003DCEED4|nr:DUF4192 domain-containing protein [Microbispora sp. ATCC PTA-5024]ETK34590.1 hypothetical protein MPTA5024_18875 [Microbispora sp. ATCC PTA-5024]